MGNLGVSATLGLDAFEVDSLELRPNSTEDDLQLIIVFSDVCVGQKHLCNLDFSDR